MKTTIKILGPEFYKTTFVFGVDEYVLGTFDEKEKLTDHFFIA